MAVSEKQVWADTPFKLISETGALSRPDIPKDHASVRFAFQMSLLHNGLLRAFNSAYNQATRIPSSHAADFLAYCQVIYECLHEHHTVEEECFFPLIEEMTGVPGLMDGNVDQHKAFESGLTKYKEYVFNTKPEDYNGEELRSILDSFGHILQEHLHDEIPTLLGLHIYDHKKLMEIWDKADKKALSMLDKHRHGPLVFGCQDANHKIDGKNAVFPDCPFFVPYIVRYVYERKYQPLWQFTPSTSFRVRREFPAIQQSA